MNNNMGQHLYFLKISKIAKSVILFHNFQLKTNFLPKGIDHGQERSHHKVKETVLEILNKHCKKLTYQSKKRRRKLLPKYSVKKNKVTMCNQTFLTSR